MTIDEQKAAGKNELTVAKNGSRPILVLKCHPKRPRSRGSRLINSTNCCRQRRVSAAASTTHRVAGRSTSPAKGSSSVGVPRVGGLGGRREGVDSRVRHALTSQKLLHHGEERNAVRLRVARTGGV